MKCVAQICRHGERFDCAAVGLHHGARTVGRQFQRRQSSAQLLFPKGQFFVEEFELLLLPDGEIGVLNGRFGQLRRFPCVEALVNRGQFPEKNAERPAVENNVVHRQHENVSGGGEPQQFHAQERQPLQIERTSRFIGRQAACFRLAARWW